MIEANRIHELKSVARGRWPEILTALGGVDAQLLDGKHHPCPRCGGRDRFRAIDPETGACFCNACLRTRNGDGISALQWLRQWTFPEALDALAEYLGAARREAPEAVRSETKAKANAGFTADDARRAMAVALRRAGELAGVADHPAVAFLRGRGLLPALDRGACGILDQEIAGELPEALRRWPAGGYQVLAGLYNVETAELVAVQGRDVTGKARTKVMTARGSRISGTAFANRAARDVIRGKAGDGVVVLAEGLTDSLALVAASTMPSLAAPGVNVAAKAIGPWARGRAVVVALDADDAGEAQVKPVAAAVSHYGGRALRLRWPAGQKDACDALQALGLDEFRTYLWTAIGQALRGDAGREVTHD